MILTAFVLTPFLTGNPLPPVRAQETSEATAEGIEILRRLLAENLEAAFPSEEASLDLRFSHGYTLGTKGLVTQLMSGDQVVPHSRGFHLPGEGAFFALDLELPVVAAQPASAPKDGAPDQDDEWERMRRQVRGTVTSDDEPHAPYSYLLVPAKQKPVVIDPAAIDTVVEVALKTLARHAPRIEGLAVQDTLTLALHLSGRFRGMLWHETDGEDEDGEGSTRLPSGVAAGPRGGEASFLVYGVPDLFSASHAPELHLVIRVTLSDLAGYSERGGPERVLQRARINRY
jgi:hypothetical protein